MLLGVNVDHVATLRQARGSTCYPDPVLAALIAQDAGADSIVMHLREDRRHIQDRDIFLLKDIIDIEFNLEMSLNQEIVDIACRLEPDKATIVPEKRRELTTEGGFDVAANPGKLRKAFDRLITSGIEVSVFIDPVKAQIKEAYMLGIKIIELHTGAYAQARTLRKRETELRKLRTAAQYAAGLGMFVAAGHGLSLENARPVAAIKEIEELNIGHSIISDAVFLGLKGAIKEMRKAVS